MKKLLLKNNIIVFILTLVLALVFLSTAFYFEKRNMHQFYLDNELQLVKRMYLEQGITGLHGLDFNNHIQLINVEGSLIYDNRNFVVVGNPGQYSDLIKENLNNPLYQSIYANTNILSNTISVSQKVSDNVVIRITSDQFNMRSILTDAFIIGLILAILLTFIIEYLTNKMITKLVKPINDIRITKDYKDYPYIELQPLLNRLSNHSYKLDEQVSNLASKENELTLITDHMSEGILLLDTFDNILMANPKAKEVLGINEDNINRSVYNINNIRLILDAINGKNNKEMTIEVEGRHYKLLKNAVFENNAYVGIAIFIFDITDSALQENIRKEFSANVSHELKTPLTSISGFAELLKAGIVKQEDIEKFGGKIYDESQRLLALINDILKLSNLENNDLMKKQEVDFSKILEEIETSLHDKLEEKHQQLSINYKPINFYGYQSVIHDIIYNIVENACKYSGDNSKIKIDIKEHKNNVTIAISDNGLGIKNEDINRIFERFYRSDKSHSQAIEGTGLGLSIVKHSVLLHNGSIDVKNNVDGGATFTITLPKESELNPHA